MNIPPLQTRLASAPEQLSQENVHVPQRSSYAGTYSAVLERLITSLTTHQNTDSTVPLLLLSTDARDNWAVGLLQAWAIVIDVLTFYQERIANEGYLRTATERRSILELARATGYELRPGISARTYLAFTVRSGPDEPPRHSPIPLGTAVQSVPTQNSLAIGGNGLAQPQLPQIFETSIDFEARSEWNALKPLLLTERPGRTLDARLDSLRLSGEKTGLRTGDTILLIGDSSTETNQSRPWILARVSTVEVNSRKGYTRISWEGTAAVDQTQNTPLQNPQVFALRQQAKLYSYTPAGVYYTPFDTIDWSPSYVGLPSSTVHTLLLHQTGTLFVGMDEGIFRSTNDGENWEAVNSGLARMKISALTDAPDGKLYAGSDMGTLYCSEDVGTTWRSVVNKQARRIGLLAPFK